MSALPLALLVYATQGLAGFLLLAAVDRAPRRPEERLARALLLGPAALAVQMVLMHAVGLRFTLPLVLGPWWLLAAAVALRRAPRTVAPADAPAPGRRALLALAATLFTVSLVLGLQVPVATTDAMHNFAVIARVFETHGSLAPEALARLQYVGHTDYPPLVPLNEALVFLAAGDARTLAIKPFFALADLALLLLVIEACLRLRPSARGAALAAFVLLAPVFGLSSLEGYADLRLAASVLLLGLHARELHATPSARGALLFALAAACCALTKFEGLALALLAAPWPLLLVRRGLRPAAALGAVALLLAVALAWPAHLLGRPATDVPLAGTAWHDLPRAAARWPGALAGLLALTVRVGGEPNTPAAPLWVGLALLVALGLRHAPRRRAVGAFLAVFVAQLLLYATVLALSPMDLEWHVATAGPRLMVHALPWLLLAACAALAPPLAAPAPRPAHERRS